MAVTVHSQVPISSTQSKETADFTAFVNRCFLFQKQTRRKNFADLFGKRNKFSGDRLTFAVASLLRGEGPVDRGTGSARLRTNPIALNGPSSPANECLDRAASGNQNSVFFRFSNPKSRTHTPVLKERKIIVLTDRSTQFRDRDFGFRDTVSIQLRLVPGPFPATGHPF